MQLDKGNRQQAIVVSVEPLNLFTYSPFNLLTSLPFSLILKKEAPVPCTRKRGGTQMQGT
jgi:hypothetical protein